MNIQSICSVLGNTGCCLFSFIYAIGIEPAIVLKDFNELVDKKIIAPDATVLDYNKLGKFYNYNCSVSYESPYKYIKDVPYLGRFVRNNFNHFVVMKNGNVIWNPLDNSKCVSEGTLTDIRVIREI